MTQLTRRRRPGVIQGATRLLLGVVCVAGAVQGFRYAAADFIAIGPRATLNEAAGKGHLPRNLDWGPSYRLLATAADIKPRDARMQYELGRIAWIDALNPALSRTVMLDRLDRAASHLERAARLRPAWGRTWADLANVHYLRGHYTRSLADLRTAMRLTPYELATQQLIVGTGFALWPVLDDTDRAALMTIARHVARYSSRAILINATVPFRRESLIRELVEPYPLDLHYLERRVRDRRERHAASPSAARPAINGFGRQTRTAPGLPGSTAG